MAEPTTAIRIPAPAKLNLYLHVVGRRDDGYHLLDTLFAFVALGDAVEARPADALALAVEGPFAAMLGDDRDNLVLRAARALDPGGMRGARLRLEKNLPVASGLGGGSADAAATLRALTRLWASPVADDELHHLAVRLGADVPACLKGRPSFGGGTGEILVDAPPLPAAGIVLVNPGIALSTPEIFARRCGAFSLPSRFDTAAADAGELARRLRPRRNDLTPGAVERAPVIGEVLAALERSAGCHLARMSGSGATCFGIYDDPDAAHAAAASLGACHPRWWVAATRLLGTASIDRR